MGKSKLTLVIDGNWLLMSRFAVLNNKYIDNSQLCHELQLLLVKSINVVLRQFPQIDNILFVSDGGSWRNQVPIPKFLACTSLDDETKEKLKELLIEYQKEHPISGKEIDSMLADLDSVSINDLAKYDIDYSSLNIPAIEYKGQRVADPSVDWDAIFGAYEHFISVLQSNGITAVREQGVEGDDWIWYWTTKLNAEGTNCIIWSRDKDLTQLVNIDNNKCFTVCWCKETGLTTSIYNEEDLNFLFNVEFNQNEEIFNYLCEHSKSVTKINPQAIVVDKIIRGDAGDNIMPVLLRKAKSETSTKMYKVAVKDLDPDLDIYSEDAIRNYFTDLLSQKNYIGRVNKTVNDVIEHFKYNARLVALQREMYPQEIIETMEKYDTYTVSKDIAAVQGIIQAESSNIYNILELI